MAIDDLVLAPDGDDPLLWLSRETFLHIVQQGSPRGKNIYSCDKCGYKNVTVDIHRGVTPSFLKCPVSGCEGTGHSYFYVVVGSDADLPPEQEWYRPSREEFLALSNRQKDHVLLGGLLKRKYRHQD